MLLLLWITDEQVDDLHGISRGIGVEGCFSALIQKLFFFLLITELE